MWFSSPSFLKTNEEFWPAPAVNVNKIEVPETRIITTNLVIEISELPVLTKFSSFSKLIRAIAWLFRFITNCKTKSNNLKGNLSSEELRSSTVIIAKLIQQSSFLPERKSLQRDKPLPNNSKLLALNPYIDDDGTIRAGGRPRNTSIAGDIKHPIVLSKDHFVTKLIIKHEHEKHLHAGAQATLAALRQRFWIISGKSAVRQVLYYYHKCFRVNPKIVTPKMGVLPAQRVKPSRPFVVSGIDYAGPVLIRESRGRGKRLIKVYFAVFVCFSIKAVHIELVADLSTQEFLGALRRFIGRRGHPSDLYSDNGTNFIGANNELIKFKNFLRMERSKTTSLMSFRG